MTEEEFLEAYDPARFPHPSMAVDLVLATVAAGRVMVLLQRRSAHPFQHAWALPGSFVGIEESLDAAAARVLADKAGLGAGAEGVWLEQLYTFGAPGRDPRTRVIAVAYFALLPAAVLDRAVAGRDDLALAGLDLPVGAAAARALDGAGQALPLAFDHGEILAQALLRLRGKLDYAPVAFALLPARFTLRELQDVHEAILGQALNKPAFRRRMIDQGWIEGTGLREAAGAFRPAELYTFRMGKGE